MKQYRIVLETLGPVHIGSGIHLNKSEYLYDKYNGRVHVINGRKLTKFLKNMHKLDNYIDYCQNTRNINLYEYLKELGVKQKDWHQFVDYSIPVRNVYKNNLNNINPFIRDGQNETYIPASSVKGNLRKLLTVNDKSMNLNIFRNLSIEDSAPLSEKKFSLYQKVDIAEEENTISLFRESLDVNQQVELTMTIKNKVITKEELEEKIALHYRNYYEKYLSGFQKTFKGKELFKDGKALDLYHPDKESQIIFLGGGVGYAEKRDHYQIYEREKAKSLVLNELKKVNPYNKRKYLKQNHKNVPTVLKVAKDVFKKEYYLQGACKIKLEEM